MPPSTALLNRKPTQTKAVLTVLAAIASGVAAVATGPVGVIAGALAGLLLGAAHVKRPGD